MKLPEALLAISVIAAAVVLVVTDNAVWVVLLPLVISAMF